MDTLDPAAVTAAFALAGPAVAPALAARLGEGLAPLLRGAPSSPDLADAVRRLGDPALLGALAEGLDAGSPSRPPHFGGSGTPGSGTPKGTDDPVERAGLPDLAAHEVEALLDLDDPPVDARLFSGRRLPRKERTRLLAGVRRNGGRGRVPGALTEVLWTADLRRCAEWLACGMSSGDPEVARVVVNRLTLHTDAGPLRVLSAVWERYGAEEARRVWAEAPHSAIAGRDLIERALGAPDGLAVLRTRLAAEEEPGRLAEFLLEDPDEAPARVGGIVADGGTPPWAHLLRVHETTPLPRALHGRLAAEPDCPHTLLVDLLHAGDDGPWLSEALAHGTLSGADVFEHTRPAALALSVLTGAGGREAPKPPRAEARALAEAHLGADPEAWVIALRLFPGFPGTLPELLATAGAMSHR